MRAFREFMAELGAGQDDESSGTPTTELGVPTGVAVFAADLSVRSVIDPAGSMAHWAEYDRGGHFPAMEVPNLLVQDIRTFFGKLRN